MLTPAEIIEVNLASAEKKAKLSVSSLLILGFLAGVFIAFGGEASNMIAFNLLSSPETFGLGRLLAGSIFPVGLMLVVLFGAELWTGNCLMLNGLAMRKIPFLPLARNWLIVYAANFIGSVFVAVLINVSGILASGDNGLGITTVKIAAVKCSLTFGEALALGVLCNALVCLAVLIASGTKSLIGKIFGIFFPIFLFVASGFEHSIANMYYIPAGLIAKGQAAFTAGLDDALVNSLTIKNFLLSNLLPVTLGNLIGGGLIVGILLLVVYRKK
jgi:formate/nitrite transporter